MQSAIAARIAGDMRRDPGTFGNHGRVDVFDPPAGIADALRRQAQQLAAVGITVTLIAVRKELTDVAEPGRAEDCVGDRVQQHIGVGVAEESALERDLDAADDQSTSRHQRMNVETLSDAKCCHVNA